MTFHDVTALSHRPLFTCAAPMLDPQMKAVAWLVGFMWKHGGYGVEKRARKYGRSWKPSFSRRLDRDKLAGRSFGNQRVGPQIRVKSFSKPAEIFKDTVQWMARRLPSTFP
jgi:hypothetical protein